MPSPKNTASEISASLKSAAATLGLDVLVLKDAKKRGCPAFRANQSVHRGELIEWLKSEQERMDTEDGGESDGADDDEAVDTSNHDDSIGETLKNIAKQERFARQDFEKHRAGNPMLAEAKRKAWMELANARLKYHLKVKDSERDAGELITRSDVVSGVEGLMAWLHIGISGLIHDLCPRFVGLEKNVDVAAILDPALRESLTLALEIGSRNGLVPAWLAESAINQQFIKKE